MIIAITLFVCGLACWALGAWLRDRAPTAPLTKKKGKANG